MLVFWIHAVPEIRNPNIEIRNKSKIQNPNDQNAYIAVTHTLSISQDHIKGPSKIIIVIIDFIFVLPRFHDRQIPLSSYV
jgi:hypothetical protein